MRSQIAFEVFNREEESEGKRKEKKPIYALFAAAYPRKILIPLACQPRPACVGLLGLCFRCNQTGHWAKSCLNPQPLTKPCLPTNNGTLENGVTGHYPSNLGVLPRPKNNGSKARFWGPWHPDYGSLDERGIDPTVPLSYFTDGAQLPDPEIHPIQTDLELRVISTVGWTQSLIHNRHWSCLFTFNLL